MIALTWQTLAILLLAYFAGCFVGCLARKIKGAGPVTVRPAEGLVLAPAAADPVAPHLEAYVPPPPAAPVRSLQNAFRRADRDTPADAAASGPPAAAAEPSRPGGQRVAVPVAPPVVAPPVSAAVAVAAATAMRTATVAASGDDLTRIRAIDRELEAKLRAAGIMRYGDIAAWTSEQVKAISQQLGFAGRIERENWIEQAHILARGGETEYAMSIDRVAAMPPPSAVQPSAPSVAVPRAIVVPISSTFVSPPDVASRAAFAEPRRDPPAAPAAVVAVPTTGGRENLQRIGGISAEIEDVLNAHGITRYSQVAGWRGADIERLERLLGFSGRINRENWIEQAQILANGGATAYSREFDRRGGAPAPLEITPAPPAASPPPVAPPDLSGMRSVRSEAFRGPDSLAPPPSPRGPDDLKRIRGIGLPIETKLRAIGISTYEQIAGWTATDVAKVSSRLELDKRIERENWIEQAQILARGGATAYAREVDRSAAANAVVPSPATVSSPPAAPPPPTAAPIVAAAPASAVAPASRAEPMPAPAPSDLSGMRSVRSAAYRGEDSLAPPDGARMPDDLKRIRGIGVLLERKLNAMGVMSYEQIANWTADDVGTVNTKLDFKGRIERENWIEQARILASGGHTDFSRRFERGEV